MAKGSFKRWFPVATLVLASTGLSIAWAGDVLADHPQSAALERVFQAPLPPAFKPTGVTRASYLKLIAGNVDYFKTCQNPAGAIIDPVSHGERQYSTPAFAAAAGILVQHADRKDLLAPATRALTCALNALVEKRPADKHADFYIPLLVHAYRSLKDCVAPEQRQAWEATFKKIDPETMYRADLRKMNWNIVSSSGELLRRHDGLVAPDRRDAQMAYLEQSIAGHLDTFKPIGLVEDPGAPMAYDAFSRLWLEDAFADNAYPGSHHDAIERFLRTGGLSTLLLLSPTGEWANGGRSSMHNWTDAEVGVICEINASIWKRQGRADVAGAFKRAAHLAFESVARWQRPSGELWIIKNHAEPPARLAYEPYSNHSQYNLLPMAMLAIAYERADETIDERPTPSEVGGYVFDVRDTFHKIAAAAGGYYVLIDTSADPHYNATGLQRVHKAGVLWPALSDTVAGERAYGPKEPPKVALSTGAEWPSAADPAKLISLANFSEPKAKRFVKAVDLASQAADPQHVAFEVHYTLAGDGPKDISLTERYDLTANGVEQISHVDGITEGLHVHVPVLVNDGANDIQPSLTANAIDMTLAGSQTRIEAPADSLSGHWVLTGPKLIDHSGYVREAAAPVKGDHATLRITLEQK